MKIEKKCAIAGIPNSGKSTIFSSLTGTHQHIGNWPGVTVEKKEGLYEYKEYNIRLIDLPGTYSLNVESIEAKIAKEYIIYGDYDVLAVVIEAPRLERGLIFLSQILEITTKPIVLVINMMDELEAEGRTLDIQKLQEFLKGISIVSTSAIKGKGLESLKEEIYKQIKNPQPPIPPQIYSQEVEELIKNLTTLLENSIKNENVFVLRNAILRYLEGNEEDVKELLKKYGVEELLKDLEVVKENWGKKTGIKDINVELVNQRYGWAKGIIKNVIKISSEERLKRMRKISDTIDTILLHPILGVVIFITFLWVSYELIFSISGPIVDYLVAIVETMGNYLSDVLTKSNVPKLVISFLVDGILNGVGTVFSFSPLILILYIYISFFENLGYLSRIAVLFDRFLHIFGLHGNSFFPFFLGFGCNVPGIVASRVIDDERARVLTALTVPFASCSARLPVYVLMASLFFPNHKSLVIVFLYILGILIAGISSYILSRVLIKGSRRELLIELPPYRLPPLKLVWLHAWVHTKEFLRKVWSVILLGTIFIWLLASLPFGVEYASEQSFLGFLGKLLLPIFKVIGVRDWRVVVSIITGIVAKETAVSTFSTLFSGNLEVLKMILTPASALSFLVFYLLYFPCIATFSAMKRELGWKYTIIGILNTLAWGFVSAILTYYIFSLVLQ